jgi:hypothetical protein
MKDDINGRTRAARKGGGGGRKGGRESIWEREGVREGGKHEGGREK